MTDQQKTYSAADLQKFTREFGAELGVKFLREGLSIEEARKRFHVERDPLARLHNMPGS